MYHSVWKRAVLGRVAGRLRRYEGLRSREFASKWLEASNSGAAPSPGFAHGSTGAVSCRCVPSPWRVMCILSARSPSRWCALWETRSPASPCARFLQFFCLPAPPLADSCRGFLWQPWVWRGQKQDSAGCWRRRGLTQQVNLASRWCLLTRALRSESRAC